MTAMLLGPNLCAAGHAAMKRQFKGGAQPAGAAAAAQPAAISSTPEASMGHNHMLCACVPSGIT